MNCQISNKNHCWKHHYGITVLMNWKVWNHRYTKTFSSLTKALRSRKSLKTNIHTQTKQLTQFIYLSYIKNVHVQPRPYSRCCNFQNSLSIFCVLSETYGTQNCPFVQRTNHHHLHNFTHRSWLTEAIIWFWGQSAKAEIIPLCAVSTVIGLLLLSAGFHNFIDCKNAQVVRFHSEIFHCYLEKPEMEHKKLRGKKQQQQYKTSIISNASKNNKLQNFFA